VTQPNVPETATPVVAATAGRALPRVNLLPPEIHEAVRFRRFQLAMAGAGVAAVAIVAALGVSAHNSSQSAKNELAQAQATHASLQSQLGGLQSVKDVYAQVAARKAMLAQAMGSEVRWSYYLTDLSLKVPDHVWLTNVTATQAGAGPVAGAAATTQSALPTGLGTVTFSGTAFSHDDVASWLDMLAKEKGFVGVYFTNSTKAYLGPRAVVNFTSSATLSQAALSGRYSAEG
jgi:Tfp pilus assembly protein PilN